MFNKLMKVSLLPLVTTLAVGLVFTNSRSVVSDGASVVAKKMSSQKIQIEQPSDNYDINVVDSEKSFDSVVERFLFSSPVSIDYVSKEGEVDLVDFGYKEGEVFCDLTNFTDNSNIILDFYQNAKLIDRCTIYFAKSSSGLIYSSAISLDTALRNAGQELSYNLANETEDTNASLLNESIITPYGIGASGTIYGTLKWTDE